MNPLLYCVAFTCLLAVTAPDAPKPDVAAVAQGQEPALPEPATRLKALAGQFAVVRLDSHKAQGVDLAEALGLKKGAEVTIRGNELRSGTEVLATLTTDFSATGLDLDKEVHVSRHPVLLTLPSGKGLLCASENDAERGFVLVHPHNLKRNSEGTFMFLKRVGK
ncbi:hypothetical protein [Humisphaera borealis]|uniref:Uncharacterized protein n=1 Tax=Humisphaera borealis TaxID=2807512 RepID=A0A7M2WZC7_9BACT|nr:hypothetical protein [Humisphaera borealis]QOV90211.1 hypothetical protein IPV69_02225 [Humisphaera borealis]